MWSKKVSRKELADILNAGGPSSRDNILESHDTLSPFSGLYGLGSSDDLELLWKNDPFAERRLPAAIIVDRQDQKDLLAWINTYVPSIRPLTAYIRLADRQTASDFLGLRTSPRLGMFEGACLGMIIGETLTYIGNRGGVRNTSHIASLSTLSFAIARAVALGLEKRFVSEVETSWSRTRELLGAASLPINARAIQTAWSVVRYLSKGDIELPAWQTPSQVVLEACSQILSSGEIHNHELESLSREVPEFAVLRNELGGPREERLALFEQAIKAIPRAARGNSNAEFLCAYLASAISPGTLDHLHVLLPHVDTFPSLLIWYGLCAGLSRKQNFGPSLNGLGRRVQRELFREDHFLQTPSCDISFTELQIISKSARDWTDIPTSAAGQFVVELLPCTNSYYRSPRSEGALENPSNEMLSAVNDLRSVLNRADESISRFRRAAGLTDSWETEKARKRKAGR